VQSFSELMSDSLDWLALNTLGSYDTFNY